MFNLQVLFLSCEDLMSPLTTVALGNFQTLEIHVVNTCSAADARNIFILKTICSPNINPNNVADLNYIWDLMYNATWPESTHQRFKEDVKNLHDSLPLQNIMIAESFQEELKELSTGWLSTMETFSADHVLADR